MTPGARGSPKGQVRRPWAREAPNPVRTDTATATAEAGLVACVVLATAATACVPFVAFLVTHWVEYGAALTVPSAAAAVDLNRRLRLVCSARLPSAARAGRPPRMPGSLQNPGMKADVNGDLGALLPLHSTSREVVNAKQHLAARRLAALARRRSGAPHPDLAGCGASA